MRFLCPNGHLGFAPIKTCSFDLGVATEPDFILAGSGSSDIGPGFWGMVHLLGLARFPGA